MLYYKINDHPNMTNRILHRMLSVLLGALLCVIVTGASKACASDDPFNTGAQQDDILKQIGVDEKLGGRVPLDTVLKDQDGRAVKLGDYFIGNPVILTLNYYDCPMLCPITFSYLAQTLDGIKGLTPGVDYKVVTVSINPDETTARAREKATETHAKLKGAPGPDGPDKAWPFLTGGAPAIKAITSAVGYRYVELSPGVFAHPTAFIVLSPDGRVSRYFYGLDTRPVDMKLALTEAADGKIGKSTALNRVLLFCYHYDPEGGKYVLAASRLMTAGGAVVLILLAGLIIWLARKERKL